MREHEMIDLDDAEFIELGTASVETEGSTCAVSESIDNNSRDDC